MIAVAAVLWSTSGLFLKSPVLDSLPKSESGPVLAFYRALFAAACLLPLVRRRSIRWRPMLVPMTVSFSLMNVLFVTAMTLTTAAATVFLQYTSIVWAGLIGWVILRERLHRSNVVTILAGLAGIGLIVAGEGAKQNVWGDLIAVGSGVSYAGVIVCLRFLRNEDSAFLVTLNHTVAALALLPWLLWSSISLSTPQWLAVSLLGVVQLGVPYVLFARGIRHVKAQEAALIVLIEPVLNPVWVWLAWNESADPVTWAGGGLILGGLAVRYCLIGDDD